MLVDLVAQGITGKAADAALGESHITVNKNAVPNDPSVSICDIGHSDWPLPDNPRIRQSDCRDLAGLICDVLDNLEDAAVKARVRDQVKAMCDRLPVYR